MDEVLKLHNKTVQTLVEKNFELANNIGKRRSDLLNDEAKNLKIAIENAQVLNNLLFNP